MLHERRSIRGKEVDEIFASSDVSVGRDLAELLMNDYRDALSHFDRHPVSTPLTESEAGGFNHG